MDIGGINSQQVSTTRTEGPGQTSDVRGAGDGIGGHQARVGEAPGRGIGHLLRSIGDGISNVFKSIGNFFAKIGNMITGRANGTDQQQQAHPPQVQNAIDGARNALDTFRGIIEQQTSKESFRTLCLQCMTDDEDVQSMLEENLDNPDYSKENFTGIEDHPSDPSKFVAKFGGQGARLFRQDADQIRIPGQHSQTTAPGLLLRQPAGAHRPEPPRPPRLPVPVRLHPHSGVDPLGHHGHAPGPTARGQGRSLDDALRARLEPGRCRGLVLPRLAAARAANARPICLQSAASVALSFYSPQNETGQPRTTP